MDRFHSRDKRPYWFNETKESICIKPRGSALYTNMAAIPLFLYTNMAAVTSCENDLYDSCVITLHFKDVDVLNEVMENLSKI